jgi:prepilin-type N-terminal cleavage/methylation domain-containing protein
MSRNRISGFTLIELMVVIVIIGVLASLAIPRFTEASAKAKVAEAPRVLASFESAYLAARAELSAEDLQALAIGDLVFEIPGDSRWFAYTEAGTPLDALNATAKADMAKLKENDILTTTYTPAATDTDSDCFTHNGTETVSGTIKKMVPNFWGSGCTKP